MGLFHRSNKQQLDVQYLRRKSNSTIKHRERGQMIGRLIDIPHDMRD